MRKRIYEIIDIAQPHDRLSKLYDQFMVICIVGCLIPLFFKETNSVFLWLDRISASVFILDYCLRWLTADFKFPRRKPWIFLYYPFTPFAIMDWLSIMPTFWALNSSFKLFRLLRLGKALRVLKLLRYSRSFRRILRVMEKEKHALCVVYALSAGYVLLSALIMFQVEPESFSHFFDAVYWALITLTTVGYGDIYPVSDFGRLISMLSSFIGIAIIALPTSIITAGYVDELHKDASRPTEKTP